MWIPLRTLEVVWSLVCSLPLSASMPWSMQKTGMSLWNGIFCKIHLSTQDGLLSVGWWSIYEYYVGPGVMLCTKLGLAQSSHCNLGREGDGEPERWSDLAKVTQGRRAWTKVFFASISLSTGLTDPWKQCVNDLNRKLNGCLKKKNTTFALFTSHFKWQQQSP